MSIDSLPGRIILIVVVVDDVDVEEMKEKMPVPMSSSPQALDDAERDVIESVVYDQHQRDLGRRDIPSRRRRTEVRYALAAEVPRRSRRSSRCPP